MSDSLRLCILQISSSRLTESLNGLTLVDDFERSLEEVFRVLEQLRILQKIVDSPAFFTASYKCPLS